MMVNYIRFIFLISTIVLISGCLSPQKRQEVRLGEPPATFIFFEESRHHIILLEDSHRVRYQVLDGTSGGVIDWVEGTWSEGHNQLVLMFDGADSKYKWNLKIDEFGYELMNPEAINLKANTVVRFRNIAQYDVALRFYEWELGYVEGDGPSTIVQTPSLYSFRLKDDTSYALKADCNKGVGRYEIQENMIEIRPAVVTNKQCLSGSLSAPFVKWLTDQHMLKWGDSYHQLIFTSSKARLMFNAVNGASLQ